MQTHTVVGIGELLWDCFGDTRRPGGAPANVAFHAGQLGIDGVVVSRVGADPSGDALLNKLAERGLSTHAIQRDAGHPTGLVTVDMTRRDQPVYTIHEDAAWDYIEFDSKLAAVTSRASAICFGTLAQRSTKSRETIHRVLDESGDALLICDVNLRPPWYTRELIETPLHRCHVAKLNDEELPVVAGLFELGPGDTKACARALRERFDVKVVCVTCGERGCLVVTEDDCVQVPGRRVEVEDTVGAGDAFTAALICGLLWKWPVASVAQFANEVGAMVAGRRGAMPDLRGELTRLRDRIAGTQRAC